MTKKEKDGVKVIDPKLNEDVIFGDLHSSDRYVSTKRDSWSDKEDIFLCKNSDSISEDETKSQIHDPRLSTMIIERSGRVTNQLPTGRLMALTKDDRGKSKLMNLVLDKYVYPNAKSQFPLLTKLKLMDMYSLIYGSMFGLVDWVIDKQRGYMGPDLFLVNIRDVFPQAGAISLEDSEFIYISTLKTKKWLQHLDKDTWNITDELLDSLKGTSRSQMDSDRISTRYADFYNDDTSKENPMVEVVTRYERDKWITFLPGQKKIIRTIENPHKNEKGKSNGELPVIAKHCFPLMDDFFGLGEVERAESLQKSLNSLINLYFDSVKMSLFPPLQINTDEVVASSIKQRPGAKWFVDRPNESVQPTNVSPQGLNTFQGTYQFLLAALENQGGSSSTSVGKDADVTLGKTPQALNMQAQRENTRDAMDRYQIEQTVEAMVERFANLQSSKMEAPLVLSMFAREAEEIEQEFPDIVEMFESGQAGKVTIAPDALKAKYRFEIDSGSMVKHDEEVELQNLNTMLMTVMEGAQLDPQSGQVVSPLMMIMEQGGKRLDVAELFKKWVISSGIQDWDKIIIEDKDEDGNGIPDDQELAQLDQQLAQMEMQINGEQMGGQEPMGQPMGMPQGMGQAPMPQGNPMMGGGF